MGHHNNGDLFFGLHLHDDLRIRLINESGGLIQEEASGSNTMTEEFAKKLAAISQLIRKGFLELKFCEDFSIFIMLIFIGLGIAIFLFGRRSE